MNSPLTELGKAGLTFTPYLLPYNALRSSYFLGIVVDHPHMRGYGKTMFSQFDINVIHLRTMAEAKSHLPAEVARSGSRPEIYSIHDAVGSATTEDNLMRAMEIEGSSGNILSKEAERLFVHCAAAECERLLSRIPDNFTPAQMFLIGDRLEAEPARPLSLPPRLPDSSFPIGQALRCSFRMPATPWGYKLHMAIEIMPIPFRGRERPGYCLDLEIETDEDLFNRGTGMLEGDGASWAAYSGGAGSLAHPYVDLPVFPQSRLEDILAQDMDVLTAAGVALEIRAKFAKALTLIQDRHFTKDPSISDLASLEAELTAKLSPFSTKDWI